MNRNLVLAVTMIFLGTYAKAQYNEAGTSRSSSLYDSNGNSIQRGFAGYLGAGAGYSGYNSNIDVEGAPTSLKLLASYVTDSSRGVFDAGYGIQSQTFSQDAATDSSISTGVLELASRYQFESRWQLGAVYNQIFNKGANYGANQADAELGGLQLLREFSFGGTYLGRIGGRLMTSINVNNQAVNMAIIDFQIGWGGSASRSSTALTY